jgi:hypothetical protein
MSVCVDTFDADEYVNWNTASPVNVVNVNGEDAVDW